jgi:hypothetical protein
MLTENLTNKKSQDKKLQKELSAKIDYYRFYNNIHSCKIFTVSLSRK